MPRVYRTQEVDLDNFVFSDVTENAYGGKTVYVNYPAKGEQFHLQVPKMYNAWGLHVSQARDKKTGEAMSDPRYFLQLSFGKEPKATKAKFHKLINDIDEMVKEAAKKNCVKWFKQKELTDAVLNQIYTPMIKYSVDEETLERDGKYPDSIRFKIPVNKVEGENGEDRFVFPSYVEVYDENEELVKTTSVEDMSQILTKGSNVVAIVQLGGVYFAGGKFGLSWKVVQMQVFPRSGALQGFQIANGDDDNDNDDEQGDDEDSV